MSYLFKRSGVGYLLAVLIPVAFGVVAWLTRGGDARTIWLVSSCYGLAAALNAYDMLGWRGDKWLLSLASERRWHLRLGWFLILTAGSVSNVFFLALCFAWTFGAWERHLGDFVLMLMLGTALKRLNLRLLILLVGRVTEPKALPISQYWCESFRETFPTFAGWMRLAPNLQAQGGPDP